MKPLHKLFALAVFSFLLISCTQENDSIDESLDLTATINTSIKNQIPHLSLDTRQNGIYLGVIASGTTLNRGKIWINIANDTQYGALVEMVGGDEFNFELVEATTPQETNPTTFEFICADGRFVLDLTNFQAPRISEASINGENYFASIVKSRSHNRAASITAIFSETGNPLFSGTWNLVSDGSIMNPNGDNGEAITSLMVTLDTQVFIDTEFDNFDSTNCMGIANFVPTLSANEVPDTIMCDYQTTPMAGGISKWSLGYDPLSTDYVNWITCSVVPSGSFTWTDNAGTFMRIGTILVD